MGPSSNNEWLLHLIPVQHRWNAFCVRTIPLRTGYHFIMRLGHGIVRRVACALQDSSVSRGCFFLFGRSSEEEASEKVIEHLPLKKLLNTYRRTPPGHGVGFVVVIIAFTRIIKSGVTGQTPVTLEWKKTTGKNKTEFKTMPFITIVLGF